ncbi:hypothetical protein GCM10025864_07550 [Luteimicrobium album]|uniref:Luciferase-like domain-containing protein n=1 Tax=Luteimicrobium album TaxID=1054550 RepID=A0ABQ6HY99_9MICO|nr:hypothetical protein GCM10025864_07550 [Luteimicrobium album]
MSDYGHDLVFGSFLTPQAGSPDDVVGLAVLSEEVGLDLVTFQDHPYNAGFLDTWTLLSFAAARTERVHLSPNVANLPLRPPAVLARAAASLDLLSHGRAELGLGSGAFWDGVAAMGGTRLTPGEGVDALEEAIDVIRGIWDADDRTVLRAGGEHHHVAGARRGPRPDHAIGLWLGAYKPRMLRLTGSRADGWLPSMGYLQPGDLARGNAVIDEAAQAAGRDPREVRRLLNVNGRFRPDGAGSGTTHGGGAIDGPVAHWVDELVQLALEDGVGTFILGSDDPHDLTIFAQEVAPAVREQVAAERASSGTATGPVRSPRALALRSAGIDYDAIPARLRDAAVEPGTATTRTSAPATSAAATPASCCGRTTRRTSSRASASRASSRRAARGTAPAASRSRSAAAATASPGCRRTTAGSSSTSRPSTRSPSSTRRRAASGSVPVRPGATWPRRSPSTAGA